MKIQADKLILAEILKELNLSAEADALNLSDFSKFKLTDYQRSAVKSALKILEFYYASDQIQGGNSTNLHNLNNQSKFNERENLLRKYCEFDKNLKLAQNKIASKLLKIGTKFLKTKYQFVQIHKLAQNKIKEEN